MRELSLNNCRLDKRYDIQQELGRGSYAEIYIARDIMASPQSPHNLIVIKALNVFLQDDPDRDLERTLVENFQNEAIAIDRVRHPNIISRLGHGTARDLRGAVFHYLVLEYLPGGDLQRAAREKRISLRQALKYVEQICAGLRHAHRNGVIHRDIKPQNLLLTRDAESVKIADFGVARFAQSDSPITRVGTNVYAPPEHSPMLAGQTGVLTFGQLTTAADIYSLAKSMYMLITSESPRFFANQPITELPLLVRNEEWSQELTRVLRNATQSDPKARPQTVDQFWADLAGLRQYAEDGEIPTHVGSRWTATPQPHVSRGYSPLAPRQPHFDTSRDLKLKNPIGDYSPSVDRFPAIPNGTESPRPIQRVEDYWPAEITSQPVRPELEEQPAAILAPKKKRRFLRSLAAFTIFIFLFGGALYGTHMYLRTIDILPDIRNPLTTRTGIANTDIYLRPTPNTNNDPIGLVTKNSKVRIVNSQNNWYEVDVLEQGRVRPNQSEISHGWLNGKYLDID